MNLRTTLAGMALTLLGLLIPIIGWFLLLPVGLILMIAGLVMKEKVAEVRQVPRPEEILLDVDLATSEMYAMARKIPELSREAKTDAELAGLYATALEDAKSKIDLARHLENSLAQAIEKVTQQLQATESTVSNLERSREVYGVRAESLETKMAQERSRLDELRANIEKLGNMLRELRLRREELTDVLGREVGREASEMTPLYLKVLMKYREKYGEAAGKKLERDLTLSGRSLEELYSRLCQEKTL